MPNRPNRWRRRLTALLACAVAMTGLSACMLRTSEAEKEIHVLTVADPFFYALQDLLPQFERETGIKVSLEGLDYNTLDSRSTNSFLTHQSDIDVISPDSTWLSRFVNSGWLLNLNDLIHRDRAEVKPQDFIPNVVHSGNEWNGGIYTLPVAAYGMNVLYRADVFKKLGIPAPPSRPSKDWTWKKYLADIQKINGKTVDGTKMYGTVVAGSGPQPVIHMYSQLAASMGARWFQSFPNAKKWNFAPKLNSADNVEALKLFTKLYKNSPPQSINYVWFDAGTAFAQGNVGMFYWWTPYDYLVRRTSYMGTTDSKIVGKYKTAAMPVQPGKQQVISLGNYSFGISKYSKKTADAWKFIKWASSAKTQRKMALLPTHLFSDFARKSLYHDPKLLKIYDYLPTQLRSLERADGKAVRPPIPNYTTIEGDYGQAVNRTLAGDLTPKQALDEVQDKTDKTLRNELYLPWKQPSHDDTLANTEALLRKLSR